MVCLSISDLFCLSSEKSEDIMFFMCWLLVL
jgi:hypothetical protein